MAGKVATIFMDEESRVIAVFPDQLIDPTHLKPMAISVRYNSQRNIYGIYRFEHYYDKMEDNSDVLKHWPLSERPTSVFVRIIELRQDS